MALFNRFKCEAERQKWRQSDELVFIKLEIDEDGSFRILGYLCNLTLDIILGRA